MSARSGAIFPDTKYDLSGRTLDLGHSGQMRTICFGRHDLNVSCPHLNERASTRGPRRASRYVPPKLGMRLPMLYMFDQTYNQSSPVSSNPIQASSSWRETYDMLQVACREWQRAIPQTMPTRQNLALTERGPAVGVSPRPMGGVNAPENTQTVP